MDFKNQARQIAPGVDIRGRGGIEVIYDPSQPELCFTDLSEPVEPPAYLAEVIPLAGSRALSRSRPGRTRSGADSDLEQIITEGIPPGQHE